MILDLFYSIDWFTILTALAKIIGVQIIVLTLVSYTVYAERRVSALMQDRFGPNRVGFPLTLLGFKKDISPFLGGLGQPIADALKLLLKEDFMPAGVNKFYYCIAPALGMALDADSLRGISLPVSLMAGDADVTVPVETNVRRVARLVPKADVLLIPGASHYTFLDACHPGAAPHLPLLCLDNAGVDRDAIHDQTVRRALMFFARTLSPSA